MKKGEIKTVQNRRRQKKRKERKRGRERVKGKKIDTI